MKERPLPEEGHITDKLTEAVAPLPPDARIAIAPAAGRPNFPLVMPGPEGRPLPFGFTRRSLLVVGGAFFISLCLFGYGAGTVLAKLNPIPGAEIIVDKGCLHFLAVLAGGSFLGGALGAVIGKASRDDKGVAPIMGAFVGALAGPLIVLILLLEFFFFFSPWMSV